MRRAAKVDANHEQIVFALRSAGVLVLSLAAVGKGVPDLLCLLRGRLVLVEVKDGAKSASRRKLTDDQVEFHRLWLAAGAPLVVVESAVDALRKVGVMQ